MPSQLRDWLFGALLFSGTWMLVIGAYARLGFELPTRDGCTGINKEPEKAIFSPSKWRATSLQGAGGGLRAPRRWLRAALESAARPPCRSARRAAEFGIRPSSRP